MRNKILLFFLQELLLCFVMALPIVTTVFAADNFYVIPFTATTFKGDWSVSQTYAAHDVAFYNGSSWFSLKGGNKGNQPDLYPAYWTLLAKKGDTGPAGPTGPTGATGATGATGPQGPVGSAVKTSAVCVSASNGDGDCSCNKTLVSKVVGAPCNVTSETGNCSANGYTDNYNRSYRGACCVCAPY